MTRRKSLIVQFVVTVAVMIGCCGVWPRPVTAETKPSGGKAVVVTIKDAIDDVTFRSLTRRVDEARKLGASTVILELDTPGGMVTSALDICNYLKNLTDMKTVAWVHPAAYSAGAMIAVSCDEIVMSSSSRVGDCAPIMLSPTDGLQSLGETERAKAESPILAEFRDAAHRHGYDPLLCESMVKIGSSIWWVENVKNGERKFIRGEDKLRYLGKDTSSGDGYAPGTWRLVAEMRDVALGKMLEVKQPVVGEKELLTMKQNEAAWYGFSRGTVSTDDEIRSFLSLSAAPIRLTPNWAEAIAAWLSSPVVRSILFVLILMGAYAEFHAPGHMLGGAVAVIALALFLGAPYITGLANVWEIVVIIIGIGLIAVEFFATPGLLLPGLLGLALILVGVVSSFAQPEMPAVPGAPSFFHWPRMQATWDGVLVGVKVVSGGLIVSTVLAWLLSRYLPRAPLIGRVIAPNPTPEMVLADDPYPHAAQVGDVGVVESLLRPAGKARFGPVLVDVVSESDYIEPGTRIVVLDRRGNRVVVRKARD